MMMMKMKTMTDKQQEFDSLPDQSLIPAMRLCSRGHHFKGLACDTCSKFQTKEILRTRLDGAIANSAQFRRILQHITLSLNGWIALCHEFQINIVGVRVPALCGADLSLHKIRYVKKDDERGMCPFCEARLKTLTDPDLAKFLSGEPS